MAATLHGLKSNQTFNFMNMANLRETAYLGNKERLKQDNIFPPVFTKNISDITGYSSRRGLETAIISGGKLVNVVSNRYSLLLNETFFGQVEEQLRATGYGFKTQYINRENGAFAADYILDEESAEITINRQTGDIIRPMLRFTNSYDGSVKTAGRFGFFREVCKNGLHVAESKIGFSVKHVGDMQSITMPQIRRIIDTFMKNEFYEIRSKFEKLSTTPIDEPKHFVKFIADTTKLFKYESSEKNPEPSINARIVLGIMERERQQCGSDTPDLWHGYNAFNELLHDKMKKTFEQAHTLDSRLFNEILQYA